MSHSLCLIKRRLFINKIQGIYKPSITDEQLHQICDSVCSKV